MAKTLFVQYPRCGTCRKAAKWLDKNKIEIDSRDITVDNPTKKELDVWIDISGLPIQKFFNTSGLLYREHNLKEVVKTASRDRLLDILANDGMLVKRPIVVANNMVLVGFNEEEWADKLK